MASKLRDKILNAVDTEQEEVYVKQWDVKILVKGLTGKERDALLQKAVNMKTGQTDMNKLNTWLVIESCYDPETGEKIFEPAERFGCPVSVLLENISSKELTEWMAFYKIRRDEQKEEERKANRANKARRRG